MANPLNKIVWDAFPSAESYEVAAVPNGVNLNTAGSPLNVITVPAADPREVLLGQLLAGRPAADYGIQIRAAVPGGFVTAWSDPILASFVTTAPGVVTGVSIV